MNYVPACADDQVGVHRPLGLVQSVYESPLLGRTHLHDVPPYWSEVNGGRSRREGRKREDGVVEMTEDQRKRGRKKMLLKINTDISFPEQ